MNESQTLYCLEAHALSSICVPILAGEIVSLKKSQLVIVSLIYWFKHVSTTYVLVENKDK